MEVCGNICNAAVIKFVYFIRIALELKPVYYCCQCFYYMPRKMSALTSGGLGNHSEKSLVLGRLPCKAGMDVLAQVAVVDADYDVMTDKPSRCLENVDLSS